MWRHTGLLEVGSGIPADPPCVLDICIPIILIPPHANRARLHLREILGNDNEGLNTPGNRVCRISQPANLGRFKAYC